MQETKAASHKDAKAQSDFKDKAHIRRHFEMIGHPVMGDPRYGRDNKHSAGLQLAATGLEFQCPFSEQRRVFQISAAF